MKYKIGDEVRIKSFDWYTKNKEISEHSINKSPFFNQNMAKYCGTVHKISEIIKYSENIYFKMLDISYSWIEDYIEPKRKELFLE